MLPTVTFTGTVVADPEIRFTPSGQAVASMRVACNDRKRDAQGQWTDGDTTFLSVTVWQRQGENLADSVGKGDLVVGYGRLKQRDWQDKEGNKRTSFDVVAESVGPALAFRKAVVDRDGASPSRAPSRVEEEPPF